MAASQDRVVLHSPSVDTTEILSLWVQREKDAGPRKARDRETLEFFEGRVAVPLPEIDKSELPAVANLMAAGITATAQRIASTDPQPVFPPRRVGQKRSELKARQKRRALLGMWDENRLHLQRQKRARWLLAYATSPIQVRPCFENGQWSIRWDLRSPLATYAAPTPDPLNMTPSDVIFASSFSASRLEARYTDKAAALRGLRGYNPQVPRDTTLTLVEYNGPTELVLLAVGTKTQNQWYPGLNADATYTNVATVGDKWALEIERVPNRIGRCTVIVPNGISLEDPMSRYEGMKGLYQRRARLMALEYRAVANSVDPQQWFVEGDTGGEIITMADGPAGVLGHLRGGTLETVNIQPGYKTTEIIDRFEESERKEGGVPGDVSGISGSNIRTGARGQDVMSAVLDFPIQEAQTILAESQKCEDDIAMELALELFPDVSRSWGGFEFTPSKTFEKGDWHNVSYAMAGTDADGLVIRSTQLVGATLMSHYTAMEMIPQIKDAEFERDKIMSEQITQGILGEFMQPSDPSVPGGFGIAAKARVAKLVAENTMELADAILKVQADQQALQSTTVNPAVPGSPETMPGISGVGEQAGAAAPIQPDAAGLQGLLSQLTPQTQLSRTLRTGQRTSPQEQVAAQAGVG